MNKHFYRVVFNRARGMLMVVSELVRSHSGESRSSQKAEATEGKTLVAKLTSISFLTYLSLGLLTVTLPAQATTIRVDPNADKTQRPTVIESANGTTQINIQTPNSNGLSHNRYTQFDVSDKGVILNNSNNSSNTQLGGWIKGNEFLGATGGAKIILNEVNTKNPSQIAGYIEVAGQRAQVIIANAAGITCNGCGFINASRGTLTTGKPIIENGQLKGYEVSQGHIAIEGKGLDSTRQDYTDLIARTVSINSSIHANNLNVVTGRNRVSADAQQVTKLADDGSAVPVVALDVSALGGMYAGKIQMIGTEGGVGVRNAGSIGASAGSVTISADGRIENNAKIYASENINIQNNQSTINNGEISSQKGSTTINTKGELVNNDKIISQNQLTVTAKGNITNTGSMGTIEGKADINSQANIINSGELSSEKGDLVIHANNNLTNTGKIFADNKAQINAGNELNNQGTGSIVADHIRLQAITINNVAKDDIAPAIAARAQLDIAAHTINNVGHALIYSDGDINIGGQLADESGVTGQAEELNNHSSNIEAADNIQLSVNKINNINDHFEVEIQEVSRENIIEYQHEGSYKRYSPSEVYFTHGEVDYMCIRSTGSCNDYFYKYVYERVIEETVITQTDPAKIIAGKDITIKADHLLNDKSQIIAGNTLTINANSIENIEVPGQRYIKDNGTAIYYYRIHEKGSDSQGTSYSTYRPTKVEDITLRPSELKSETIVSESGKDRHDNVISLDNPEVTLPPPNSLFQVNPDPQGKYLIETDSRFTNRSEWLGSDYMLTLLKQDPDNIQKRLGDGYYEQKLVREQIIELTGQRYLGDYTSDLEQYKALMDAGVEFAQEHNLSIGIALTAEQMKALTSDIVWMVSKTVTLADGSQQQVLVPQVYAVVKQGDLNGSGALLAGRDIDLSVSGDINNQGRIIAGNEINITAENISNGKGGNIQGSDISLTAQQDINNIGGHISANESLSLTAGRDITISSTINKTEVRDGDNSFVQNTIGSVGSLSVNNDGGQMSINAGRDVNLNAAQITANGQESQIAIEAGNNVNLGVVETTTGQAVYFDSDNYTKQTITTEVGSAILGNGDISIKSGNDVAIKGAQISAQDTLDIQAKNDLTIEEARQHIVYEDHTKTEDHSGGGTSQTINMHTELDHNLALGSQLSGGEVNLSAGRDMLVQGSQVVSETATNLDAGRDITITAAEERFTDNHFESKEKSGFMSGGGLGFTYGTFKESTDQNEVEKSYLGSMLGSTEGSVNINAGRDVAVRGSEIIAKEDIAVNAENITIESLDATTRYQEQYEMEKTGITVAITGTASDVYNAGQAARNAHDRGNSTISALNDIKAGLTTINAGLDVAMSAQENNPQGNGASIGVSASVGTERTERTINEESHNVVGSGLSAGNNITLNARGNEAGEGGDILIKGSEVRAGNDINLSAANDVNVIGDVNTQHRDMDEKSSSASIGVGVSVGANTGWTISGNANFSRERENMDGSAWTESVIDAGNNLNITTGRDMNIIGGIVKGDTVTADIGNNLNIASLQDTDNYDYDKISGSISGSFGPSSGAGGNISLSQTEMESNWSSVTDQSGIYAGSGGFDIRVENNTDLKGAVIASEAKDKSDNVLDTGTISFSDIENKADYNVDHVSVNIGTNGGLIPSAGAPTTYENSDSASSTTHSAVEEGTLIVRDEDKQKQDVNELSRDTENANNSLGQIFDKQKEQDRMDTLDLLNDIAALAKDSLNKVDMNTALSDYNNLSEDEKSQIKFDEYYKNRQENGETVGGMGSSANKAIDSVISIVTGLITGDVTGGLAGASAPWLAEQIKKATTTYGSDGKPVVDMEANLLAHTILGAVVAELQGNSGLAGGAGALTGEAAAALIIKELYGNRDVSDLSEAEKQNISSLAQLAAGLAAAAGSGGDVGDIGTAVAGSKNAVENNKLSPTQKSELEKEIAACGSDWTCNLKTQLKWANINLQQDNAYVDGLIVGWGVSGPIELAGAGLADILGTFSTNPADLANKDIELGSNFWTVIGAIGDKAETIKDGYINSEGYESNFNAGQEAGEAGFNVKILLDGGRYILANTSNKTAVVVDSTAGTTKVIEGAGSSAGTSSGTGNVINKVENITSDVGKGNTGNKAVNSIETQVSVDKKLTTYLLDKDHPVGGSKAEWFDKALGFNQSNSGQLSKQIVFDTNTAVQTGVTEFGTKYNQVIKITGANGKQIDVNFGWIKNNDGVVRLVTAIPTKK
ncbi:two-partner secretion domain-containing protein [Zophobihabitans entericus]|uniref:Filamentous hemagglutinin N-terminal domain-containing protein n=1 Tax=Zophobihabitans entericus TaxID=1635327 RepID=A0A6G9IEB4_9GAMM|nr:hemagglutinin repeat-containing protein [Zophobihabitans entericus]QIQ22034.1 filamentous hemagglutinin N-terminal domain-containing protein [Zophobihabitans entericus]